ncbi:MAG: glycoside hydrolase family 127 protein [Clostridia bacterium]|nr:glycoside hydrolase family 127 protein [Clostridia bacterium]
MLTDHKNVRITAGYWREKADLNRDVTMNAVYDRFHESGRIDAFRCDWKEGKPNRPHFFWDSDVAKWMEGAAYILGQEENPALEEKVEALIDEIEKNQGEDGYFNIYFTVVEPEKRWSNRDCHELYCAGHLMEAACAYYNATGRGRFLSVMEKYADYIAKVFTVEHSAAFNTPGHEEIELALYKMYKTTGKEKYLDLMKYFLETRGQPDNKESQIFGEAHYAQSHAPIREQHEAYGHSVRAMYLYSAMADLAAETGDKELLAACRDLFEDVTERKMYITGGIGSTNIGEAFTIAYDLPNAHAYTETCASIGLMFFANRMFRADPVRSSKYADIVELEMYNGALSGLSLDGEKFFYENPLEIRLRDRQRITATHDREHWPITQRVRIFGCSCCPPNINRLLPALGDYFYGWDEEEGAVYVNQFGTSEFTLGDVKVTQTTGYPMDGTVKITSNVPVYVRIPGWCGRFFKADRTHVTANGYARFEPGEFTVTFEMKPMLVSANVEAVNNIGKAALRYGPFIYCAEGADNGDDVHTLFFDRAMISMAKAEYSTFFGAPVITLPGLRIKSMTRALYAPLDEQYEYAPLRMIPYAAFANRGECDMLVWLNVR